MTEEQSERLTLAKALGFKATSDGAFLTCTAGQFHQLAAMLSDIGAVSGIATVLKAVDQLSLKEPDELRCAMLLVRDAFCDRAKSVGIES